MAESRIKKNQFFVRTLSSGDDLNNIRGTENAGAYYITTGVTNAPVAWTWLLVLGGVGTIQILFGESFIRIRAYTGNPIAWTSWKVAYLTA